MKAQRGGRRGEDEELGEHKGEVGEDKRTEER